MNKRKRETKRGVGVVRSTTYIALGGGGGDSIILLKGFQASSARPSGKSIMK
jgi:hypothetical protein